MTAAALADCQSLSEEIILEKPIFAQDVVVGWHSLFYAEKNSYCSGGTSSDRLVARRKATAEHLERKLVVELAQDLTSREAFSLDKYPSSCGFACGFNRMKTQMRALCEGVERWAVSQWIDHHFHIPRLEKRLLEAKISPLGEALLEPFSERSFYELKLNLADFPVYVRIFLGETATGIFYGARATLNSSSLWEHEIVEAYRNISNFTLIERGELKPSGDKDYFDRLMFFGNNKDVALNTIQRANRLDWPHPEILLLREFNTSRPGVYLWRCLFKDYIPWGDGPIDRFIL